MDKNKVYYQYEIIDVDTGEIYKGKINNKEFKTVKNEQYKESRIHRDEQYTIVTTRRIVKHNGQQRIEF